MGMPGGGEWIVILIVVVVLFGAKKIPDLAKGLGEGIREFKKATKDASIEDKTDKTDKTEKPKEVKNESESAPK